MSRVVRRYGLAATHLIILRYEDPRWKADSVVSLDINSQRAHRNLRGGAGRTCCDGVCACSFLPGVGYFSTAP